MEVIIGKNGKTTIKADDGKVYTPEEYAATKTVKPMEEPKVFREEIAEQRKEKMGAIEVKPKAPRKPRKK